MWRHTLITNNIGQAAEWLLQGECVGVPTETVYGLAANALNPAAVVKIFEVKNRPSFDPLIVHIGRLDDALRYSTDFPVPLRRLAEHFWPGPLTILVPRTEAIPDLVTSGLPRVGLRMPAHPVIQALLSELPFPLAAPSANPFGYISPTSAQHVLDQLSGKIPCILDGGPCSVGVESTIVGMEQDRIQVYRLGGLPVESLEAVVGPVEIQLNQSSNPHAPGMLASHYAPRKPLSLLSAAPDFEAPEGSSYGLLSLLPLEKPAGNWVTTVLSENGDLAEAAANLFAAMRRLDQSDVERIYAIPCPEIGLGRAINDRLRRAAHRE